MSVRVFVNSKRVRFPKVCPKCLSPADDELKVSQYKTYVLFSKTFYFYIPFCKTCVNEILSYERKRAIPPLVCFVLAVLFMFWGISASYSIPPITFLLFVLGIILLIPLGKVKDLKGVKIAVKRNGIEFTFDNPEYAKIFKELNRDIVVEESS